MGLLIAGLIEALIAWGVGLYLLFSSSVPHIWGGVAFVVGLVVLILSMALGRRPREEKDMSQTIAANGSVRAEDQALLQQEAELDEDSLDSSARLRIAEQPVSLSPIESADEMGLVPLRADVPAPVDLMHDTVMRSRWRYRARDAETRAAALAEMVLHEGRAQDPTKDERPRQLRRLCDLAILSQGFDAWATGKNPEFHLERYRQTQTVEDIHERLGDFAQEASALEAEAVHWQQTAAEYDDPYRRSLSERVRFEKLSGLEERFEEITLLQMGYQAMLDEEAQ